MNDMVERKITNNPSICISFVPPFFPDTSKNELLWVPGPCFPLRAWHQIHSRPIWKHIFVQMDSSSPKTKSNMNILQNITPAKLNIPQMVGKMLAFSINAVILEILSYISGRPSHPRTLKKFVSPLDRGARGPNHPFSQSGKRCCTSTSDCRLLIFWATKKKKHEIPVGLYRDPRNTALLQYPHINWVGISSPIKIPETTSVRAFFFVA